jgi:hypothetical protein
MMHHLTTGRLIEVVAAVLLLGLSIYLYRSQRNANQGYGSQGAVLLLVISAIMGAHGLGAFDYHPSEGELEMMKERGQ